MDYESADNDAYKQDAEREKINFERCAGICAQKTRAMRFLLRVPVKKIREVAEKTT